MKKRIGYVVMLGGWMAMGTAECASVVQIFCERTGPEIKLDGAFKAECDGKQAVRLMTEAGKHVLEVKQDYGNGSYDYFKKEFRIGDGVVTEVKVELKREVTEEYRVRMGKIDFIRVPGGSFRMGSNDGYSDEKPVHTVSVNAFELGKYEVTQGQWQAVMGGNPSKFSSCGDNCPVEQVSWDEVQGFIGRLNARGDGCTYRLPKEAEWEYACRSGGRDEKYCGGNDVDRVAWYNGNSENKTHPVGGKAANGLGLYDMSGNVWEWTCSDWGSYSDSGKNHAKCSSGGSRRVQRGGGWDIAPASVRSALRYGDDPDRRSYTLGFRLARTCP